MQGFSELSIFAQNLVVMITASKAPSEIVMQDCPVDPDVQNM